MSLFSEIITSDLESIESDMDNPTFYWQGNYYSCLPEDLLNISSKGVNVGFDESSEFSCKVRTNQFSGRYPELNDYITFDGINLLIKTIKKPSHNKFWILVCEVPKFGYK